jgi:hypothetical protein
VLVSIDELTTAAMVGACANKAPEPARTNRTNFFNQNASTRLNSNNVGYNELSLREIARVLR